MGVYPQLAAQSAILPEHGALGERRRRRLPHRQERRPGQIVGRHQTQSPNDLREAQPRHEVTAFSLKKKKKKNI